MSSKDYEDLFSVNQQLKTVVCQLDSVLVSDLEQAENLADILLKLMKNRQSLLYKWLPMTTPEDAERLKQQQEFSQYLAQRLEDFKHHYGDELTTRISNKTKVNLYKTLDTTR
ncbi:hypothetical protein L9G15_14260 [Shewanella sp. A3A]|nr:hypothetical protein [Shewanella ferrihydritica]